jgi:hypothetical protein
MSPDAAFVEFFSGDYKGKSRWDLLLEAVEIPGMAGASWDRKAAYLLWLATDKGRTLEAPAPAPSDLSHGVFD